MKKKKRKRQKPKFPFIFIDLVTAPTILQQIP